VSQHVKTSSDNGEFRYVQTSVDNVCSGNTTRFDNYGRHYETNVTLSKKLRTH